MGGVADGRLYKSLNDMAREWSLVLPRTQDYLITVVSPTDTRFVLEVNVSKSRPTRHADPVPPTPTTMPAPTA